MKALNQPSAYNSSAPLWRIAGAVSTVLVACAIVSVCLLMWLKRTEAGNPDLGDAVGILTIYAVAVSIGAAVGVLFASCVWTRLPLAWAGLVGPVSAAIGFLSKDVVKNIADSAGLPRPGIGDLYVGVLVSLLVSLLLYFLLWRVTSRVKLRRAA